MTDAITEVALQAADHDFRIRVYPAERPNGSVLVWLHGGAFMFGTIDMPEADAVARAMAGLGVAVVSVDYTLAPLDALPDLDGDAPEGAPSPEEIRAELAAAGPRARFPVASLQTVAAFDWVVTHAAELRADPRRVAVGGASAGGNIAAGAALRLRDRGTAVPSAVLLAYPVLHVLLPEADDELLALLEGLPSMLTFPPGQVSGFNINYVGEEALLEDPYAFPGGHDLRGLPPVLLVTADRDRLRASAQAFAAELAIAGGDVELVRERAELHGFLNEVGNAAAARTVRRFTTRLTGDRTAS